MSVIAVEPIFPLAFGGVFAETGIPLFYWYPTLIAENSVCSGLVFESSSTLLDTGWLQPFCNEHGDFWDELFISSHGNAKYKLVRRR